MKKRLIVMLMALCMIVSAVGCGKDNKKKEDEANKKPSYKITDEGVASNDYVKIKKWKGLEIEKVEPVVVTDDILEMNIKSDYATIKELEMVEVTNRGAKVGDQVTISYVGKIDGVAFEGGTSKEDDTFILGQGRYIDGFQEGIIGYKQGEEFPVEVTFPDDYGKEELNGKDAVFTITLKKVEEQAMPELTDEIVKQLNPNVKTVEEYKTQMKADLEKSYKQDAEDEMCSALLTLLYEQSEAIEYPEDRLKEAKESMKVLLRSQLEYTIYQNTQMTLDSYMSATGATEDELFEMFGITSEQLEEAGKEKLFYEMVLELVAEIEDIPCSDKEYKAFLKEEKELWGYETIEEVEESYNSTYGTGYARFIFLQIKVSDYLLENCVFVEPAETVTE